MSNKTNKSFDVDFAEIADVSEPQITQRKVPPVVSLHSEKQEVRRMEAIIAADPKRCRMWAFADRDEKDLNEKECADLMESLSDGKKQLLPALARRVESPDYDFELIYGNRRRWVCEYYGRPLELKLTEEDDMACLAKMHVENAKRKDISQMERCRSFLRQYEAVDAQGEKIYSNIKEMANNLSEPVRTVNRMIKAGGLWKLTDVVGVIGNLRLLTQNDALKLIEERENSVHAQAGDSSQYFDAAIKKICKEGHYKSMDEKASARLILQTIKEVKGKKSKKLKKSYDIPGIGVIDMQTDVSGKTISLKMPLKFLSKNKLSIADFFVKLKSDLER